MKKNKKNFKFYYEYKDFDEKNPDSWITPSLTIKLIPSEK